MKTAIVHEWFVDYMGSEKCVESFNNIYPQSDVFSLIDFLDESDRKKILKGKHAKTSFIQKLPRARTSYRSFLPLFPLAIEQLDVSDYDVIISSSHSVAKGVLTNSKQLHICYCHTPMRYAWDLYHQYILESGLQKGIKAFFAKYFLHKIRMWDFISSNRVDYFIANSNYIAKRIKKIYGRDADVIYPPVDIDKFELTKVKEDYYLIVARFVPYKKVDIVVDAFTKLTSHKLIVIGSGPDEHKLKKIATSNIEFKGYQNDSDLTKLMQKAKAFIYAAEEDFGITIVEAQAAGTPVIAYGEGGAKETVVPGKTGILFNKQTSDSLINAVNEFEKSIQDFNPQTISDHAKQFSRQVFESRIKEYVEVKYQEFLTAGN
ncbi:MAG: glycosyltransferase family 4 protein [Ignavibacteriales bacterium]|nr:MAG: glycosyltransferase family 4 protein [Ignavibacteriales bacterium]